MSNLSPILEAPLLLLLVHVHLPSCNQSYFTTSPYKYFSLKFISSYMLIYLVMFSVNIYILSKVIIPCYYFELIHTRCIVSLSLGI
jgi:hypothetical protein